MDVVVVKDRKDTYTLYDNEGDVVGRICTDTGRAMISNAFYHKAETCYDISDQYDYDETVFHCSECDCELFVDTYVHHDNDLEYLYGSYEPNMWIDNKAEYPKFCPNCGRTIVNRKQMQYDS